MGPVSIYLRELVAKQVREHGIVVWYDPEKHYGEFVKDLAIPDTTVARYCGSFFELRREVEPLIGGLQRPRLIVYVPMEQADAHHALAELEVAGAVLRPGQQPPSRNTRLSVVARNALKPVVHEEVTGSIEKQVEANKLDLDDLDRLADEGAGIAKGVISVIFGTGNPAEIALAFFTNEARDAHIEEKGALRELVQLFHDAFDSGMSYEESIDDLRARFARYLLATDLLTNLKGRAPSKLTSLRTASGATKDACDSLVRSWRGGREYRDSYAHWANRVEKELALASITFDPSQLEETQTFLATERQLQREIEKTLLADPHEEAVERAKRRQSGFWAEYLPDIQARWSLIATAGLVLIEAGRIESELKKLDADLAALIEAYASSPRPWCLIDTHHRGMERRWLSFEFELGRDHDTLEQLVSKARQSYMHVGGKVSEAFVQRVEEASFRFPALSQRAIWEERIKPKLQEGKTAYLAVDAFRFEMARELSEAISGEFLITLDAAIATVPTITRIGMAALLPNAEKRFTVMPKSGKLAVEIEGVTVRERADRIDYLKKNAGVVVFEAKLEDLLPKPKKKTRQGLEGADLVFVTSQEIDSISEGDTITLARRMMDDILHDLRRACRVLTECGVKTIIFTADHGYLFGEELGSDMKIDPPGGETVELHRRVWIGRGGSASKSYLRTCLADFGIESNLELAVPRDFACFKVAGGAKAYFHGGLSPQEVIIPVMTLVAAKQRPSEAVQDMEWGLIPGSQKISTRFFSIQIVGESRGLLGATPIKVRVEIRAGKESVSVPVSSSYGFEDGTGDVQLEVSPENSQRIQPNTVTLMIAQPAAKGSVSVHLLDNVTGAELARFTPIEMNITM